MAADYDLMVLGATAAAQTAAIAAAQTHARVGWAPNAALMPDLLMLLREGSRHFAQLKKKASPDSWLGWTDTLSAAFCADASSAQSDGVDYIEGSVFFAQDTLWVGERQLRSRAYLLAMDSETQLPILPGMDHPRVWTVPQLWHRLRQTGRDGPKSIAILGSGPQAVELSQSLSRLGLSVVLIAEGHPLLPQEDAETAFLLQSYLEGDGIQIYPGSLMGVKPSLEGLLLEIEGGKSEVEALVIATEVGRLPTVLNPLNLQQTQQGIRVNPGLQTSNPRIYAVGSLIGGYRLASIAQYEAKGAVHNALFEKQLPVRYHLLPYAIHSHPPLARVGLTEQQAQRYDSQVQVLRQTYKDCDRARFDQAPAGFCKVLVQKDGTLLGAHILGTSAADIIHLLGLAMQQQIRLQNLGTLGYASPTYAELIQHITDQWWRQRHRRDRNERWFYNRRQQMR